MNRYKKYKAPFSDRNQAGEKICVMCGKPLTGRKLRWCGDNECFQLMWIRSGDQAAMRRYLVDRDKGICAGCGMDAELLKEVLYHGRRKSARGFTEWCKSKAIPCGYHYHVWEADHIIPVSEGGEHHEDNLQILCLNCHHKKARKIKIDEREYGQRGLFT